MKLAQQLINQIAATATIQMTFDLFWHEMAYRSSFVIEYANPCRWEPKDCAVYPSALTLTLSGKPSVLFFLWMTSSPVSWFLAFRETSRWPQTLNKHFYSENPEWVCVFVCKMCVCTVCGYNVSPLLRATKRFPRCQRLLQCTLRC